MSSVFADIKERLSIIDVAKYYGLEVDGGGFISCPRHNEKTPSMKLYEKQDDCDNFHCFGCGAHGDIIDLVSIVFNLDSMSAAQKIAGDFGIYDRKQRGKPSINERIKQHKTKSQESRTLTLLTDYYNYLEKCGKEYMPKSPDEELHPLFIKSQSELSKIGYYRDCFLFAAKEQRQGFINNFGGLLSQIEKELKAEPKQKSVKRDISDVI